MNYPRAIISRGVVGQVHGACALIPRMHLSQRVLEVDQAELLTRASCEHRARELVARKARLDQRLRQHQEAARCIDQGVGQLRVQVKRLIGGDGPSGGRPDDGESVFV